MYNSFVFKKNSQQLENEEIQKRKDQRWGHTYKQKIRPGLVEKYSRRINNFIVRLEEDKKDFYEYRQETESKARELLKQISRKEHFLGDPNIKLRDLADWASVLSPTERIEKERNRRIFQNKFGDSDIAYRSIASQSAYSSLDSIQFRTRDKQKQIHPHNMRFTSKSRTFSENRKEKVEPKSKASAHVKTESKDPEVNRTISNRSATEEEIRSQAFSLMSFGDHLKDQEGDSEVSKRDAGPRERASKSSNKVYFKQIVDLQQHSRDPSIKKSLHQILVRFGLSRIKDLKKQAMVETDNLEEDQF